jgi:DNA-binding NarL/FixJ family response regulator
LQPLEPPFLEEWTVPPAPCCFLKNAVAVEDANGNTCYVLGPRRFRTINRSEDSAGLRKVARGAPMSPEIARRVVNLFRTVRPPDHSDYSLTPHELRILKLLVDGHSYKSAASEMGTAFHTIAFHVQNIYQKLQVHSKSEAVAKALRSRLLG